MCGILGIVRTGESGLPLDTVQNALNAIRHRGPDDEGFLLVDTRRMAAVACSGPDTDRHLTLPALRDQRGSAHDVALAHRRLSILDLSAAGHQPMSSPDGRYWITYNGEVYNYLELRGELAALGHKFRSGTDTEVILAAFAEWGIPAFSRFLGMFALAILDVRACRMVLARDPYGIKPLYYTLSGGFAFASEIKALFELPRMSRAANPRRTYRYLCTGITDDNHETMFSAALQLPGGHYMEVDLRSNGAPHPVRYWAPERMDMCGMSFEQASAQVRKALCESVDLHLRSDVPVGTCLSGGIDSSAIVGCMRRLRGQEVNLHAFSYITDAPGIGEERYLDIAAQSVRAVVHKVTPMPADLVRDIDDLVYAQDEPFATTSVYAQYRVFEAAREAGVKVLLDGQGGDETFAGYAWFYAVRAAGLLRRGDLAGARRVLAASRRDFRLAGGVAARLVLTGTLPLLLANFGAQLAERRYQPRWLSAPWFRERSVSRADCHTLDIGLNDLGSAVRASQAQSLPMLLRYEDRNSMAFSVESRVPFVVPSIMELAPALRDEHLIDAYGVSKAVLRDAMRGIVPGEILDRRDKIGFITPERQWLEALTPWIERELLCASPHELPLLDHRVICDHWHSVCRNQRPFTGAIWRWINLLVWSRRFQVVFD